MIRNNLLRCFAAVAMTFGLFTAVHISAPVEQMPKASAEVRMRCFPKGTSNPANLEARLAVWDFTTGGSPIYRAWFDIDAAGSGMYGHEVKVTTTVGGVIRTVTKSDWDNNSHIFGGNYSGATKVTVQGVWLDYTVYGDGSVKRTCSVTGYVYPWS